MATQACGPDVCTHIFSKLTQVPLLTNFSKGCLGLKSGPLPKPDGLFLSSIHALGSFRMTTQHSPPTLHVQEGALELTAPKVGPAELSLCAVCSQDLVPSRGPFFLPKVWLGLPPHPDKSPLHDSRHCPGLSHSSYWCREVQEYTAPVSCPLATFVASCSGVRTAPRNPRASQSNMAANQSSTRTATTQLHARHSEWQKRCPWGSKGLQSRSLRAGGSRVCLTQYKGPRGWHMVGA